MSWRAGRAESHGTSVCTEDGDPVAWVPADGISAEEAHRRAVLFAASEDLLEALKLAVWAMREPIDDWKGEVEAVALRAANAALARVTGDME